MRALVSQNEEQVQATLGALRGRIDQHLKFFDTLERIRWQFTSAFGVGAGLGLFIALVGEPSTAKKLVGHCLVVGLALAAIVTQIRIYALVVVIWKRILKLQETEFDILRRDYAVEDTLRDAFSFPRVGIFKSRLLPILTVGMVSCFVFSLAVGLSTALLLDRSGFSPWQSIVSGAIATLLLAVASLFGSRYYIAVIEAREDGPVIETR